MGAVGDEEVGASGSRRPQQSIASPIPDFFGGHHLPEWVKGWWALVAAVEYEADRGRPEEVSFRRW